MRGFLFEHLFVKAFDNEKLLIRRIKDCTVDQMGMVLFMKEFFDVS